VTLVVRLVNRMFINRGIPLTDRKGSNVNTGKQQNAQAQHETERDIPVLSKEAERNTSTF